MIDSFLDKQIWRKAPLLSPKITHSNPFVLVNNRVKYATERSSRIITHDYILHDLKAAREIEAFFLKCGGRKESFFIPSHKRDISALKGKAGEFKFRAIKGARAFWAAGQDRYLLFRNGAGDEFASKVLFVSSDEESEIITLKDVLRFNIDDKIYICELILVRLNSDEFKITQDKAAKFKAQLDFKEVWGE